MISFSNLLPVIPFFFIYSFAPNSLKKNFIFFLSVFLQKHLTPRDPHNMSMPDVSQLAKESKEPKEAKEPKEEKKKKTKISEAPPTIMTPREVSNWIDERSRIAFPIAFIIFNICYWSYVFYL